MSNKKTANRQKNAFRSVGFAILNTLLPNRCIFCYTPLAEGCCICKTCLDTLEYIGESRCERCGAPRPAGTGACSDACIHCEDVSFIFRKNESIGLFTGRMRKLIHHFKFEGRRSLGGVFADLSVSTGSGRKTYITDHDLLIPVPLAPARYDTRGYNQSFLIVRELSRRVHIPFLKNAVLRRGRSFPQSGIGRLRDRLDNMKDRFAVKRKETKYIKNLNILLVDDVLTSGATASACARVLLCAGARSVDLFTVARAVKEETIAASTQTYIPKSK